MRIRLIIATLAALLTGILVWGQVNPRSATPATDAASTPTPASLPTDPAIRRAIDPPGITLQFKDLPQDQTAQTLAKTLGLVGTSFPNPDPPLLFSLDAKDQPFAEILRQLSAQHPLTLAPESLFFLRTPAGTDQIRNFQRVGGFLFATQKVERDIRQSIAGPAADQRVLYITVAWVMDPRIRALLVAEPQIDRCTDSHGRDIPLYLPTQNNDDKMSYFPGFYSGAAMFTFRDAPNRGETVSLQGHWRMIVSLADQETQVKLADFTPGPFKFADRTLQISEFRIAPPYTRTGEIIQRIGPRLMLNATEDLPRKLGPGPGFGGTPLVTFVPPTTDPANLRVRLAVTRNGLLWQPESASGGLGGEYATTEDADFALRLRLATKAADVSIPFELKQIPIP